MLYLNSILLWFGAAISIAEIFTGTLFAPLGLKLGITIIIIGHLIGCFLMYLVGLISSKLKLSAMESTSISFGKKGSYFFATLNGLQLIGWTAVMIYSAANAVQILTPNIKSVYWSILIAILICIWLLIKFRELKILPIIVMTLLFILSILASKKIFSPTNYTAMPSTLNIFTALELSIAMPLSWLPLIGDYTKEEGDHKNIPLVSSVVYFLASSWMYIVGLACALFFRESDFTLILLKSNMGTIGLLIIILSTVTTTFLDAFSCGVSFSIFKVNEKIVSILCVAIGLLISIFWNQGSLESFLYLISSVFVPMVAIEITDFFFINKDISSSNLNLPNFIIFIIGFILYRLLLNYNFPLGISIPVLITTSLLVIIYNFLIKKGKNND